MNQFAEALNKGHQHALACLRVAASLQGIVIDPDRWQAATVGMKAGSDIAVIARQCGMRGRARRRDDVRDDRDEFSTLKNPQIPGGGLIGIASKDPIPVVDEPMVSPFNDWWWAAPAPWASVSHVPADDAHLPQGTITVGPLSPPIPVTQDGTDYADGTAYQ